MKKKLTIATLAILAGVLWLSTSQSRSGSNSAPSQTDEMHSVAKSDESGAVTLPVSVSATFAK